MQRNRYGLWSMQGQQNLAAVAELDELEYQQPYPYNRGVDLVEQQAQASALYDGQYPWAPAPAEDREWMMRTAPDTDFLQQGQARPAMVLQPGSSFEVIPQEVPSTFHVYDGVTGATATENSNGNNPQEEGRQAEAALQSWKVGKAYQGGAWASTSGLGLSARSSNVELKEFVAHRGNYPLHGLHKAAASGDRAQIMHLMKRAGPDAPIDELDANGCTALMYATMADSRLAVEMLLNFSAKREKRDAEGRTAVHYAAFFGKHRALKFLIESASDWTPRDLYGRTPLHWCSASRSTKCLSVLLNHAKVVYGTVNPRDNEGMTPVHCAAHFGRPRHIQLMDEAELSFSAVDTDGKTALHWTATNGDAASVTAILDGYPSLLNKKDNNGRTILHLTAANGSVHLVDALLKVDGIDIDAKESRDLTPLHLSCMEGHTEVVQLLLDHRALDSCIDVEGHTALHRAVLSDSVGSARAFSGLADPTHLPNNQGLTPLMLAAMNGFDHTLKVLLQNEKIARSIEYADPEGRSALHLASYVGSAACASSLLSSGADPNHQDSYQQNPLFAACSEGHAECIQTLVEGGCDLDAYDVDGQAPLHKAVFGNQADSVQALILSGADPNIPDAAGNTAIHIAAYIGTERILHLLLENSGDPNIQNASGMTAVHLAASTGQESSLEALLNHRAAFNDMDFTDDRCTPLDYAVQNGHTSCTELLTVSGAASSREIKAMAATSIQAVYRGYRARKLKLDLRLQNKAATLIGAHVRGHLQRRRYGEMRSRHFSAIKIQSALRGHLQRKRFRVQLSHFKHQERQRQLMEEFSRRIATGAASSVMEVFSQSPGAALEAIGEEPAELEDETEREHRAKAEQRTRLERGLGMRLVYESKQRHWQEFRHMERQRRLEKAKEEEMERLAGIIAASKARRMHADASFRQMVCVRSHYHAAVIIQRAFRAMRRRKLRTAAQRLAEESSLAHRQEKAARTIQKAWKRYKEHKAFIQLHFRCVSTGPVISFPKTVPREPMRTGNIQSYQKKISISGIPRHKMHQTEESGFRTLRPATREMLEAAANPLAADQHLLQFAFPEALVLKRKFNLPIPFPTSNVTTTSPSFASSNTLFKRKGLPQLLKKPPKPVTVHKKSNDFSVHLPKILNA